MHRSESLPGFVGRWWTVLLAGAVIAGVLGFVAAGQIPKTYEAETQLLVGPVNTAVDLEASGTLARTYAELGLTRPLLEGAIHATGAGMSVKQLKESTAIDSNEVTRLVAIRVQDHSAGRAARLANAIGARLVSLSRRADGGADAALQDFQSQREISSLSARQQTAVMTAADRTFGQLAGQLTTAEPAAPPPDPVKPSVPLVVLLAALAGLALAGAAALIRDTYGHVTPAGLRRAPAPLRRLKAMSVRRPRSLPTPEPQEQRNAGLAAWIEATEEDEAQWIDDAEDDAEVVAADVEKKRAAPAPHLP